MTPTEKTPDDWSRGGQVFIGLAIMVLGLGFLLDRLELWHLRLSPRLWPLLPLAFGLARLLAGPGVTKRGRTIRSGVWLSGVGLWGLVSEFHVFGLDYDTSWPLLIVAAGLNMVWRSFEEPRARRIQES